LKTRIAGNRLLLTSAIFLGALLAITPAMAAAYGPKFTYLNKGEAAYLTVTNNQPSTTFNVTAFQSIELLFNQSSKVELPMNYTYISGGELVEMNGSTYKSLGNNSYALFNTTTPKSMDFLFENLTVTHPINMTQYPWSEICAPWVSDDTTCINLNTVASQLYLMHSQYGLVGTGINDTFRLGGGLTPDTFSVTAPGYNDTVFITYGVGSSTYNINLGENASVSIAAQPLANFTILSTASVYNIIF
jgi:hypothetical protein